MLETHDSRALHPVKNEGPINRDWLTISRILSQELFPGRALWMIIPLGDQLLDPSSDLTRKQMLAALFMLPYLILLRAEFGCFHSSSSPQGSRSRLVDPCPGHSLCSTVPLLGHSCVCS